MQNGASFCNVGGDFEIAIDSQAAANLDLFMDPLLTGEAELVGITEHSEVNLTVTDIEPDAYVDTGSGTHEFDVIGSLNQNEDEGSYSLSGWAINNAKLECTAEFGPKDVTKNGCS